MNTSHQSFFQPRLFLILAGVAVAGFFVTRSSAQTVISLTGCQNITNNGNYRLANDVSSSSTCFSIRGNVTNLTFDGNGKTITTTGGDALEVVDYGSGAPSNVTVSNFTSSSSVRTYGNTVNHVTFQNLTVNGIYILGSDDAVIQNNTVGAGGIQVNDSDTIGWHPLRPIVTNNTITGGSTNVKILLEIWGDNVHPCPRLDAQVTNNTILNTRNDPPPEATASVRIRCATHTVFTGNSIRSTGTTIGLYMRDESDNGRYENNTFWTNSQEAIRIASGNVDKTFPANNAFIRNTFRSDAAGATYFQAIGGNNTFSNNIFWGQTAGSIVGGFGNTFDHNTFVVRGSNQGIQTMSYRDGPPADTWTNNIFDYSGSAVFSYDGWANNRYSGDYNLFHNRAGAVSFGNQGGSLSAWRSTTGSDANSREADPLFVNAGAGDFTLQSGSPARGAGSGGSDVGASLAAIPGCTENWSCGNWSTCVNNSQSRTCTDANSCGTTTNRPALTQTCTSSCTENWSCSAWSACTNNSQSRTCTDANSCGTTANRPPLSQSCTGGGPSAASSCPFSYQWNTMSGSVPNGDYVLSAQAVSTAGPATTSPWTSVTVTVNNDTSPPQVQCLPGQTICEPEAINISCTGPGGTCQATIHWQTDEASTSEVEYGLTTDCSQQKTRPDGTSVPCTYSLGERYDDANPTDAGANYTDHRVTLTNLQPDKLYHYRITSCNISNLCTN
ncbi:MAG: fibronectin type III domain-containing protein [Patescibacteria group bacterium]